MSDWLPDIDRVRTVLADRRQSLGHERTISEYLRAELDTAERAESRSETAIDDLLNRLEDEFPDVYEQLTEDERRREDQYRHARRQAVRRG